MVSHLEQENKKLTYEMLVPNERILRSVLNQNQERMARIKLIEVNPANLPTWPVDSFFLANIGGQRFPLSPTLLELRFAPASTKDNLWIALLMTNERTPKDLNVMASQLIEVLHQKGITFQAVIGLEALGSKLSQKMAELMGSDTLMTTMQKGKAIDSNGQIIMGPPKPWVDENSFETVVSGTNKQSLQRLFLDQEIAKLFKGIPTVLVDDAHLTPIKEGGGTLATGIRLAQKFSVEVTAVATVLNETGEFEILDVPYISLVRTPVFHKETDGFRPIPDSVSGINYFYLES